MRLRSTEKSDEPVFSFPGSPAEEARPLQPRVIDIDPLIAVINDPSARVAVQARDIQSSLSALRLPDGAVPTSIAVIGVDAPEETAVLTANVAVSAALNGLRTLLVDMAQSGFIQHRLLRAQPYAVKTEHVDDLFQVIQPSCVPSLSLLAMPAKDEAKSDVQPLCSFAQRLQPLSSHFDLSLVDASHLDDLAVAAASAEAAILAIRRDGTRTASLKSAIQKLSMLQTPLIGTVMFV